MRAFQVRNALEAKSAASAETAGAEVETGDERGRGRGLRRGGRGATTGDECETERTILIMPTLTGLKKTVAHQAEAGAFSYDNVIEKSHRDLLGGQLHFFGQLKIGA